ncbi:MAG: cupin domain-containing protein [Deinococcota bacterium]
MIVNCANAEHYVWGDGCDGWHFLNTPELSVIVERVPAGSCEVRHYHERAQQFFFVIEGQARLELAGTIYTLSPQEGCAVPAACPHQLCNMMSSAELVFLLVSAPHSHGDRVVVDDVADD